MKKWVLYSQICVNCMYFVLKVNNFLILIALWSVACITIENESIRVSEICMFTCIHIPAQSILKCFKN
jgi:hypothetical protein